MDRRPVEKCSLVAQTGSSAPQMGSSVALMGSLAAQMGSLVGPIQSSLAHRRGARARSAVAPAGMGCVGEADLGDAQGCMGMGWGSGGHDRHSPVQEQLQSPAGNVRWCESSHLRGIHGSF